MAVAESNHHRLLASLNTIAPTSNTRLNHTQNRETLSVCFHG